MSLIRSWLHGCVRGATRSRLVARAVFGVKFRPLQGDETCFDVTTPVLVAEALRRLQRSMRVLDLGTGTMAVVGLSLWHKLGCEVTAADINPESVRLARQNVARNHAPIRVFESRFFDAVRSDFDAVVFNPPYVPTAVGIRRGLSARLRQQWDGGRNGVAVVEGLLRALESDHRNPLVIMGVNRTHTPESRIASVLAAHTDIALDEVRRHPLLPVDIYVFHKKRARGRNRPPAEYSPLLATA